MVSAVKLIQKYTITRSVSQNIVTSLMHCCVVDYSGLLGARRLVETTSKLCSHGRREERFGRSKFLRIINSIKHKLTNKTIRHV